MKEQKGITLVALIITVVVLLIIAAVSINFGTDSLDDTRLKGFYAELEIIQKRVDDIATTNESYVLSEGDTATTVYLKDTGAPLTEEQRSFITSLKFDPINFKYFTSKQLETILDISGIEQDVFIDFTNKKVISAEGIDIKGEKYYTLEDNVYYVEYEGNKLILNDISYTIETYGKSYKITVTPTYSSTTNVNKYIKYKKSTSKYWETSTNLEIIIESLGDYDIIYKDSYGNSITEKITVSLYDNNAPTVTKIVEE